MTREPLRIQIDSQGDVIVCRWTGVHQFTTQDRATARKALDTLKDRLREDPKPVLLDISGMEYSYSEGLDEAAAHFPSILHRDGARVAVLLSPEDDRSQLYLKVAKLEDVLDVFLDEAEAHRFLRSKEPTRLSKFRRGPQADA